MSASRRNRTSTSGEKRKKRCTLTIELVQRRYVNGKENYRANLYKCIEDVCILEPKIRSSEKRLKKFCSDGFWQECPSGPKVEKPEKLLHYMMIYMCGDTPDAAKDASLYKRAAQILMDSNVPREKLAEALKHQGGVRKIANSKSAKSRKSAFQDAVQDEVALPSKSEATQTTQSTPGTLFIELDEGCLFEILEFPDQSEVQLSVRFDGLDQSGLRRLVLEDYKAS